MSSKGRGRKKGVEGALTSDVCVGEGQCVAVVVETLGGNLQKVKGR